MRPHPLQGLVDDDDDDGDGHQLFEVQQEEENVRRLNQPGRGQYGWMEYRFAHDIRELRSRNNEDLVRHMKHSSDLTSERLIEAFRMCPRACFLPREYSVDAYMDTPVCLHDLGFNVSAPHIHAISLQQLGVQPGHRVLDVGCGCGLVSAVCSYLVGKEGEVVGIDVLESAIKLSSQSVDALRQRNTEFAEHSCNCQFACHNVFFPHPLLTAFDRIYVGAHCPKPSLHFLFKLLRTGGCMILPVGSDLRLYTRHTDEQLDYVVINQVRFGELIVPSDAKIVLETIQLDRRTETSMTPRAEPFEAELSSNTASGGSAELGTHPAFTANESSLGECDCWLVGAGWTIPAHRDKLRAGSSHFRAKFDSGMRDADSASVPIPDEFSKDTVEHFLRYVYTEANITEALSTEEVASLARVATFYISHRLVEMCELSLAGELTDENKSAPELAPHLLVLADDLGLSHVRSVALDYIIHNYQEVTDTGALEELSKRHVELIAQASCRLYQLVLTRLQEATAPSTVDGGQKALPAVAAAHR